MKPTIGLALAVLLSACAQTERRVAATPPPAAEPPLRIIDAHAHFEEDDGKPSAGPTAKMYQEYADNNVVGAVVHAARTAPPPSVGKGSPIKFAVCAAVVPPRTSKEVEKGIDEGRYQCMKIYLAYVPKYASDPYYAPFYKLAEKKRVPVVFHTGDPYDKKAKVKYADPLTLDDIAIAHPKVTFVLAHVGNPWIQSAAEVVYKNDNMHADVSALMLGDLAKADPEAVDELLVKPLRWFYLYVENPKKILFGTDWPLVSVGPYIAAVKRAIPKKHWDDVFYGNAVRVFPSLAGG